MYGSLTGKVTAHLEQRTLIEVNGVGYFVHTGAWQPIGDITCFVYHQVREDASELFGFQDLATLDLFEKLISISGIGPKAGLAILALGEVKRIKQAIIQKDTAFLSSASGIGLKAAQKIILELEKKLGSVSEFSFDEIDTTHRDILEAMQSLGYRPSDISPWLGEIPSEISDLNAQIKWVLQRLAKK